MFTRWCYIYNIKALDRAKPFAILVEGIMSNNFGIGPVVQEMSFKRFLIWSSGLALMFSGSEPFMQFGRGHHGEHSCEIILYLDQWFRRRCCLKKSLRTESQWTKTDHNSSPWAFGSGDARRRWAKNQQVTKKYQYYPACRELNMEYGNCY